MNQRGSSLPLQAIAATLVDYLQTQQDVAAGFLFGSRARGDERADSDLDVGIFFIHDAAKDPVHCLERRAAMHTDLEARLRMQVDLVDLDRVPPLVFRILFQDAQLVFDGDPDRRALAVLRQDQLYQDERSLYHERMDYVRRRLG